MAKIKRCPKCGHTEFTTTAHVMQEWLVDKHGDFISSVADCLEVTSDPDDANLWTCARCGFNAGGAEFNCEETDPEPTPELVQELMNKLNHDSVLVNAMCDWRKDTGRCNADMCTTCPMTSILRDTGVITDERL